MLEVCVDNLEGARRAIAGGADRLEVCGALEVGGISPPASLVEQCTALAPGRVMVMIRPRTGDFQYAAAELNGMERDIARASEAGARGVVAGVLTGTRRIDVKALKRLLEAAQGMDFTFHRALDLVDDQPAALEQLIELNVPRVLTSGGARSAELGQAALAALARQAAGRIIVMPGAGIGPQNIVALRSATGACEFHASARRRIGSPNTVETEPHQSASAEQNDLNSAPDVVAAEIGAITPRVCDEAVVRQLRALIDGATGP